MIDNPTPVQQVEHKRIDVSEWSLQEIVDYAFKHHIPYKQLKMEPNSRGSDRPEMVWYVGA